jgi:hypothetical protein
MIPCSECHNCGSIWSPGTSEYDWQQCYACGWTPGDPLDDYDEDDDLHDGQRLDDDEDNDPNDSRNI